MSKKSTTGKDLISLPDEILACVLSRSSTNEAVATSFISQRWRYLYRLTDVLEFSGRNDGQGCCDSLVDPVNRVMMLQGSTPIRKFMLNTKTTGLSCIALYANVWIRAAMFLGLQDLELTCVAADARAVPLCLWNHEQLIKLKLHCLEEWQKIETVKPVFLPGLISLDLLGMSMKVDSSIRFLSTGHFSRM